ncbi:MAG: ABC transporter substrate-binding protein [Anaerolineae bacterium]|nr:ABC transporter substrate-binding protein [Anaerolineae bacterium]
MRAQKYSRSMVVNRWMVLVALAIVLALLLSGCCKKEETKVYRVGILSGLSFAADAVDGFKAGMAELGYIEGENIVYDLQSTEFDMAAYRSILDGFVAAEVDLIFVFPTEASQEAKAATQGTDIPIVFSVANIEGTGLVDSVREPGGNITGVRYPGPDIALKRFEVMRELAPEATRMLVPYQRGYPIVDSQLEKLYPVAEAAGITLIEAPVDDAAELEDFLQARTESDDIGIDAILIIPEPLGCTPDPFLVLARFAFEHQIPIGGALLEVEGYGSIFDVGIDHYKTGEQAAPLADRILRGTPAGTIPVVSSESYLIISNKAAENLGVTMPETLLVEAERVIR